MAVIDVTRKVLDTDQHYMTSPFGIRTLNGLTKQHNGVDLVGYDGKRTLVCDILAYDDGTVSAEGYDGMAGNFIRLNHGDCETVYYHLKARSNYKVGATVSKGTVLARMGTTGSSTGVHLHFGLSIGGAWVDPVPYLEGNEMTEKQVKAIVRETMNEIEAERNANATPSEWAKEGVEWANKNGVMVGDENGNLQPHGLLTREQYCVMEMRKAKKK